MSRFQLQVYTLPILLSIVEDIFFDFQSVYYETRARCRFQHSKQGSHLAERMPLSAPLDNIHFRSHFNIRLLQGPEAPVPVAVQPSRLSGVARNPLSHL